MLDGRDAIVLGVLVQRVDALERRLADLERPRLRRADDDAASALLPALAAAVEYRAFTVNDLLRYATTPGAEALRAAIQAATGPVDHATGRRLGKLLRRLSGAVVAGLTVERVGSESAGAVWTVKTAQGVSVAAKPLLPMALHDVAA